MFRGRIGLICAGGVLLCLGILVLCTGIILIVLMPSIVRDKVENAVVLKPDSDVVKSWSSPPVDASIQIWIFNVTNPNDIIFQGSKPVLAQKGPYGFREQLKKQNVSFSSSDNTVSFSTQKVYFFSPNLSCPTCKLDDAFTVPNIPYFTVMKLIRDHSAGQGVLDFLGGLLLRLVGEHPFVTDVTAGQLLYEGYEDQIFTMVNRFKPGFLPAKMGLFYGKNGSEDGPYDIKTGKGDISQLGRIVNWEGKQDLSALGWWNPNYTEANMINGTDGGIYPPFISKRDIPVFSRDICRSLSLIYKNDFEHDGLQTYRFVTPSDVFNSSAPENKGFCWPSNELYYSEAIQPKLDGGYCLPPGMLDVAKCYQNAQIVMTSPQFLFCPDEVIDSIEGLYPPSDDLNTHIDIEPNTGAVISASKKLQLNVEMFADTNKPEVFKKMKPIILPIVWLNESVSVNDATRKYIYDNVVGSKNTAYAGSYAAIGMGALLTAIGIMFIIIVILVARRRKIATVDKAICASTQAVVVDPVETRDTDR